MGYEQCCFYEVCKHYRGIDNETCKITHICKEYKDMATPDTIGLEDKPKRKYKKRGRPRKVDLTEDGHIA